MTIATLYLFFSTISSLHYNYGAIQNNDQHRYSTEDAHLNFTELANKYGNSVEEYDVITEDVYILTIFHVIPDKKLAHTPILLQHGILDSADTFILRGNKSLVRTLALAGHDVWVGNFRGNKYGRRHLKLNSVKDRAFWNYTFHDIGFYDAPAIVNFILTQSLQNKINVIGHSLGNTMFYVLGSLRPEYNEKINLLIALSPIAFLTHLKPPLTNAVGSAELINNFLIAFGEERVPAAYPVFEIIKQIVCAEKTYGYNICARGFLLALAGTDTKQFDKRFLPILMGHFPQPHSRKGLLHLVQVATRKTFSQFDYGNVTNIRVYKSVNPIDYDLSKVTMRIVLFAGKNDKVSTLEDVMLLKNKLPKVAALVVMKPKKWNHIDWVWGLEPDKYFYPNLCKFLDNDYI